MAEKEVRLGARALRTSPRVVDGEPSDTGELLVDRQLPSNVALVTPAVVRASEMLVQRRLIEAQRRNRIAACLDEGLRNAAVHGNGADFHKHVHLRIFRPEGAIVIRIDDEGNGFDLAAIPDPSSDEGLWGNRGRGLSIMSLYADAVLYYHGGRTLVLEFRDAAGEVR